jgi:hypothetical protein
MRKIGLVVLGSVLGCGLEPSNIDLGLRVEASVSPRVLSVADTAARLRIRVLVTNPTDRDIVVVTGGPPYTITSDPAESRGLTQSFRIASADEPLNAGPSVDAWGEPVDTIRAGRGEYTEDIVKLSEWRAGGWPMIPGTYRVRSYYNGREGQSAVFGLTP